jgi:hypothetical protein
MYVKKARDAKEVGIKIQQTFGTKFDILNKNKTTNIVLQPVQAIEEEQF